MKNLRFALVLAVGMLAFTGCLPEDYGSFPDNVQVVDNDPDVGDNDINDNNDVLEDIMEDVTEDEDVPDPDTPEDVMDDTDDVEDEEVENDIEDEPDAEDCLPEDQNDCGGCLELEGNIGDVCGQDQVLDCDPDDLDILVCVDACLPEERNDCGGCEILPEDIDSTCGQDQIWACHDEDPNNVTCVDACLEEERNDCGGCQELPEELDTACDEQLPDHTWQCAIGDPNNVECLPPCEDNERNDCGGCEPLDRQDELNDSCGQDLTLQCDPNDRNNIVCLPACQDEQRNLCGGCDELPEELGQGCDEEDIDFVWGCHEDDPNDVECVFGCTPEEQNPCGGCQELPEELDTPCPDPDETWQCHPEDRNDTVCVPNCEDEDRNACGGCLELQGEIGTECGQDLILACHPENRNGLVCIPACEDEERNPCGGCQQLPTLGDLCGVNLHNVCDPDDPNNVLCRNPCGGDLPLRTEADEDGLVDDACGQCGDGQLVCNEDNPNRLICQGDEEEPVERCRDEDLDGFGRTGDCQLVCLENGEPGFYTAEVDGDCNDIIGEGENIFPGAVEVCQEGEGIDDDCDELVDERLIDDVPTEFGLRNVCNGCQPLEGELGDRCGEQCGVGTGELVCAGPNALACEGDGENGLNICGGCNSLNLPQLPGDTCPPELGCGIIRCQDEDTLFCQLVERANEEGNICSRGVGACNENGELICNRDGEVPFIECDAIPGEPEEETCNNADDDCDGLTDEGEDELPLTETFYTGPEETLDVGECRAGTKTCLNGNIENITTPEVVPTEEFCDGRNNDCDGQVDEDDEGRPLTDSPYPGPEGTEGVGICEAGLDICMEGEFLPLQDPVLPEEVDTCDDELDNNCDGDVNDGCECFPNDLDEECGNVPSELVGIGVCRYGQRVCDSEGQWGECFGDIGPSQETCDEGNLDEDCDGNDDIFDTDACPRKTNADGTCANANCGYVCHLGFIDINGDLQDEVSNGCEYECTPTPDPTDVCDGADNNCDGLADEDGEDLLSNCNPTINRVTLGCTDGECQYECAEGFVDLDGQPGCEYECTNTGDEVCDGLDNDCDGLTDEADVTLFDSCGDEDLNATVTGCNNGACVYNCNVGFHDIDPQVQGCEYECTPTQDPRDVCDEVDNDCDGDTDEGYTIDSRWLVNECFDTTEDLLRRKVYYVYQDSMSYTDSNTMRGQLRTDAYAGHSNWRYLNQEEVLDIFDGTCAQADEPLCQLDTDDVSVPGVCQTGCGQDNGPDNGCFRVPDAWPNAPCDRYWTFIFLQHNNMVWALPDRGGFLQANLNQNAGTIIVAPRDE